MQEEWGYRRQLLCSALSETETDEVGSTDISDPELLLAEFHGHTVRDSEEPGSVMFFKRGRAETSRGYLVAPFDGVHGWYFSNESHSDITITLSLSGFYTIP